jgi:hypothetical protein
MGASIVLTASVERRHRFARPGVLLREYGTKCRARLCAIRGVACLPGARPGTHRVPAGGPVRLTGPPSGRCPGVACKRADALANLRLQHGDECLLRGVRLAEVLHDLLFSLVHWSPASFRQCVMRCAGARAVVQAVRSLIASASSWPLSLASGSIARACAC